MEMVRHLGVDHREICATDSLIGEHFASIVVHSEKPVLRTAPVPLYLLAKLVRENDIKVVLTGEGSDEFHGGYDIFKEALVRRFWARRPDSGWRGRLIERLYPDIFRDERSRKMLLGFFGRDLDRHEDPFFSHLIRWGNTARIKTFFSKELRTALEGYDAIAECRGALSGSLPSQHTLLRAQYLEISIFLSDYLLSSQGDRMGMAHSVEVRMPFLDHRLMDLMGRVPPWWKICGLHEKHLLKKAVAPYLPASITARVKHPYRAPIHRSLLSLLASESGRELLSKEALVGAGLFDSAAVYSLIEKLIRAQNASETDSMALSGILSTQIVFDRFVANPQKPVPMETMLTVVEDRRKP